MSFFRSGNSSSRTSSTSGRRSGSRYVDGDSVLGHVGNARLSDLDRSRSGRSRGSPGDDVFESRGSPSLSSSGVISRAPASHPAIPITGRANIDFEDGRSHPRMEHEDYSSTGYEYSSSYPPRHPLTRDTKRGIYGYEKNTYGDFPDAPFNSSSPRVNDPGYDRASQFPGDSAMGLQYHTYKQYALGAADGATRYNEMLKSYNNYNAEQNSSALSHGQHDSLGMLAWEASTNFKKNSELRHRFNRDHVGRRTLESYEGHDDQAIHSGVAAETFMMRSDSHNRAIGKKEYFHSDDELYED